VLVVKYRKQPRSHVRLHSPHVQFPERPGQAVLEEIVCGDGGAGECLRVALKARNFGFDVSKRARHRELLPLVTIGPGADSECPKTTATMLSDDVSATGFV